MSSQPLRGMGPGPAGADHQELLRSEEPVDTNENGFTLIEVTIILLVLTTLGAIMLPQLGGFNRLARFVKAREDVAAICSMLKMALDDIGESAFVVGPATGSGRGVRGAVPVGLLIGAGTAPSAGSAAADRWQGDYLERFAVATDGGGIEPAFIVDTLSNHLVSNTPGGDGANRWRSPLDMGRGHNSLFAWRGPYIDEISADPWGTRYLVNAFALYAPAAGGPFDRYASGVACLSAGPDGAVDTEFNQPTGWRTGDDDLTALLNAGGTM